MLLGYARLQETWENSLAERAGLTPRSAVAVLDELLPRPSCAQPRPHLAPRIGHRKGKNPGADGVRGS
jgi:hypothetical protein